MTDAIHESPPGGPNSPALQPQPGAGPLDYSLHLSVPFFRVGGRRAEDLQVPLAAAPGLDYLGGHDVDEDFGEGPALGIALEMVGGFVPREGGIQRDGQEQVVPVVDDDELAAGPLDGRVIDEILLGAVRPDVSFQREFARD